MNFIDTNICIRYLTRDDEKKFQDCAKFFEKVESKEILVVLLESILAEIVYVLSSKKINYNFTRSEINICLTSIILLDGVETMKNTKKVYLSALDLFEKSNLDFEDCLLIANLNSENDRIISYDKGIDNFLTKRRIEP
jgi:uncharacterized protein